MLVQKIAFLSALTALAAAQDISQDDIPQQCNAVCAEVVSISRRCDDTTDNDAAELNCICTAPNANTLVPTCEACVAEYDNDDSDPEDGVDENDVLEVLRRCSFTTTAYNTASATSILESIASSFASASASTIVTTSGTAVITSVVPGSTQVPQQTAAANARDVKKAVGIGALGLVVGLL